MVMFLYNHTDHHQSEYRLITAESFCAANKADVSPRRCHVEPVRTRLLRIVPAAALC